jgi:hypothetical protein
MLEGTASLKGLQIFIHLSQQIREQAMCVDLQKQVFEEQQGNYALEPYED